MTLHLSDFYLGRAQMFPEDEHPLALLQEFSNRDKHKLLLTGRVPLNSPTSFTYRSLDCEIIGLSVIGNDLNVGTDELRFRVKPTGPNPDVNVYCDFSPLVSFSNGLPVVHTSR